MTLYDAVVGGDVAGVKAALSESPDVNQLGPEGRTPLIEAAAQGHTVVVDLLLAAGAEPGWKDDAGDTALLKAGAHGHARVVAQLERFAEPDELDMARAFLKAAGVVEAGEYKYDPSRLGAAETASAVESKLGGDGSRTAGLHQKAVEVAARAANFFGDDDALKRVEQQQRALGHTRKK